MASAMIAKEFPNTPTMVFNPANNVLPMILNIVVLIAV